MSEVSRSGARAESRVVEALRAQLASDEILLTAVRITDEREGDVEIDVLVLFPDLGAAVVEVKGGHVRYEDGLWTTGRRSHRRRIRPVEQARRGKHALRRYLDRQQDWQHPLLRTEWFVAMPQTSVTGDLGPEGNRAHLLGRDDLPRLRERMRDVLASPLNRDPMPDAGWHDDALTLLLRSMTTRTDCSPGRTSWPEGRRRTAAAVAVAAVAVVALPFAWWTASARDPEPTQGTTATRDCHPDYEPCLPVREDLNCSDIRVSVTVRGSDPYDLDRDGDGSACESFSQ